MLPTQNSVKQDSLNPLETKELLPNLVLDRQLLKSKNLNMQDRKNPNIQPQDQLLPRPRDQELLHLELLQQPDPRLTQDLPNRDLQLSNDLLLKLDLDLRRDQYNN
jgi:hypothetical protein